MQFIDTHAHLYAEQFDEDRDEMIKRALSAGVEKLFLPNIDLDSVQGMYALCSKYPNSCFPMMGLHPCSVNENVEQVLDQIELHFDQRKYWGVGEIGIDLYWDKTFIEQQKYAFKRQIEWAKKRQLPIVIHCREAFDEIFEVVDECNDERLFGIFHCFTGTLEQANHIIDYGNFKLGIGGVLTFKKAGLDQVFEHVDLKHLVLETDAPYLSPVPYRGKRNESSYLLYIAERLSEVKSIPLRQVAEQTTANALEIFSL